MLTAAPLGSNADQGAQTIINVTIESFDIIISHIVVKIWLCTLFIYFTFILVIFKKYFLTSIITSNKV